MAQVSFHGLAAGGEGVGREESGRTVFSCYAAPGDCAEVELGEENARWARGQVVSLTAASPLRVPPPCPYFGPNAIARGALPCGGCDWQHVSYEHQLEAKRAQVAQALTRIGRLNGAEALVQPCVPSPPYEYRNKASLVAQDGTLGFRARSSHQIVDIEHCFIQQEPNNALLGAVRAAIAGGCAPVGEWKLTARTASNGESLAIVSAARWPRMEIFGAALVGVPGLEGALWRDTGGAKSDNTLQILWGRDWLEETVDGLAFRVRADGFFQTNTALVPALFSTVQEMAQVGAGEAALDLFCGVGIFALGLARAGADVYGIERSRAAIEDARVNARLNGLAAQFFDGDAARCLKKLPRRKWAVTVLDPPRAGAAAVIPGLLTLAPRRIVYVSCDPATLARDIAALSKRYVLRTAQPLDLFPQTAHVETVALLELA